MLQEKLWQANQIKVFCSLIALCLFTYIIPSAAFAQSITVDFGDGSGSAARRVIQIFALITILSLVPSILLMVTSFTRIIIVLSLLRSAMGIQQTPPNPVLISLALFLTAYIMAPTFQAAYDDAILPVINEEISEEEALKRGAAPFHKFMRANVREKDLELFFNIGNIEAVETPEDTPYKALIPAFMISELRRAFEIGFLIFVPFLVIDMMVASTLMSMGMMMLPPVLISLPFKIIFFVLIDGWYMLSGSLVKSFVTE